MTGKDNPTILVVDDDRTNVKALETLLKKEGYRTLGASNGVEAIDIARARIPDLVLLDVMMPEMDGFAACKSLQQDAGTTDIPILFLSALDDVDSKVRAFEAGAVDYISKPFQKAEILARVRLHLKLSISYRATIHEQATRLQELHSAQQAILLSPADMPAARFGVSYSPMHEAGGDFYDVLAVSDNAFGYFVADMSGHGLGASFTTPAIRVLLREHASPIYTPAETMKRINGVLHTMMSDGDHVTACYAKLNRARRQLQIVGAGHPPLVYVSSTGQAEALMSTGDVLGAFASICLEPVIKSVASGDRLFMYSDGLIERCGAVKQSRDTGLEQLIRACIDTMNLPIGAAVSQIYDRMLPGEGILEDDVVLLGVTV